MSHAPYLERSSCEPAAKKRRQFRSVAGGSWSSYAVKIAAFVTWVGPTPWQMTVPVLWMNPRTVEREPAHKGLGCERDN